MNDKPKVTFNCLLGTRDDGVRTVRLEIWAGTNLMSLNDPETVQAFIAGVEEARDYLRDIGQQIHYHTTPSTSPSVFACMGEEIAEIESFPSLSRSKQ